MPNKVVVKNLHSLQNRVRKGHGAVTSVAAVPKFLINNKRVKRVYRVFLDSGSDGDLLFVHSGTKECIPTMPRIAPQSWRTSKGTFTTNEVGDDLEFIFPEFSESKIVTVKPDVVRLPRDSPQSGYDLIIRIETLVFLGAVLDFNSMEITVLEPTLPMRDFQSLRDTKKLHKSFREFLEPTSTREATSRAVEILDANYEKADLSKIIYDTCNHLTVLQKHNLLRTLLNYKELFDGTLGDWQTEPVSFRLKPGSKPYHGRAFPIPHIHLKTLKKKVERLVKLVVLKKQPSSEWAAPTFIIPKKNKTVRFISDFREVNKRIIRTPYPIPKISTILQEMEGFTYATSLDLNMGYYTIRLDADAQKLCTIILPWGKYSYMRLPMGIAGSPDIFQEKMSGLMESLEFVRTYLDDLLILTKSTFDDHLIKLRQVLDRLKQAGLRINCAKSIFASDEIEYLGYILTRDGIKPQEEKVKAILAIAPPKSVKHLRTFLGMVQYYRDLWSQRSHLLAPLTDLISECGHTKTTKRHGTKKKSWYWTNEHQVAFEKVKETLARQVMLAYPTYGELFEIYTDASSLQLGAVITQRGRPLAFFSRKLSDTQRKYSVTELELLSIVECLKEFRGMLWGQRIKVYTDHKNLVRDALGLTSDRVYRWRLLLEEYGPEIEYIKGTDNTVADAISRLEYDPTRHKRDNNALQCFSLVKLFNTCHVHHGGAHASRTTFNTDNIQNVEERICFAQIFSNTTGEEEEIYPVTVQEIELLSEKTRCLNPF